MRLDITAPPARPASTRDDPRRALALLALGAALFLSSGRLPRPPGLPRVALDGDDADIGARVSRLLIDAAARPASAPELRDEALAAAIELRARGHTLPLARCYLELAKAERDPARARVLHGFLSELAEEAPAGDASWRVLRAHAAVARGRAGLPAPGPAEARALLEPDGPRASWTLYLLALARGDAGDRAGRDAALRLLVAAPPEPGPRDERLRALARACLDASAAPCPLP